MSDKICKSILLEIRPRLQCVNVFITLTSNPVSIEVLLENEGVLLVLGKEITRVPCKNIQVLKNSLSSLKISDKSMSFRFLTNNSLEKVGTFKAEFLQNTVASIESLSNKPLLSKGTRYTIHCSNCKKALSDAIEFSRILPLPSDGSDSSDWFCHNHGNKTDFSLDPKETDVFYSQCFVHMNVNNLKNLKHSNKVLACKYCLQWLGIQHNDITLKFWFNTVTFSSDTGSIHTSSLEDIFQTIKSCFKYSFHNSSKLFISCKTSPNSVNTLLLWVLEKKLQILYGEPDVVEHNVAKVLFKFIEKDNNTLVNQWRNDTLVSILDISKPMMIDLLNKLHKCNKLFPLEYSKSNDFKVSYLFLYDSFE